MTTLSEIAAQLSEPFALDDIDFLPKKTIEKEGKTLCMALPYADPRAYEDRLNALCPGEWSTPTPTAIVVGTKLVCFITVVICGVPHSDVGEAGPGENQGTEAWAQAFKRACSQAGLGRYLYNLEKEWVPFNTQRKMIDLDKAGKAAIVKKMYQKAGIMKGQAPKPALTAVPAEVGDVLASNGHQEPEPSENIKQLIATCRTRAFKLGMRKPAEFDAFCKQVTGKESGYTALDIQALNTELMKRENVSVDAGK